MCCCVHGYACLFPHPAAPLSHLFPLHSSFPSPTLTPAPIAPPPLLNILIRITCAAARGTRRRAAPPSSLHGLCLKQTRETRTTGCGGRRVHSAPGGACWLAAMQRACLLHRRPSCSLASQVCGHASGAYLCHSLLCMHARERRWQGRGGGKLMLEKQLAHCLLLANRSMQSPFMVGCACIDGY